MSRLLALSAAIALSGCAHSPSGRSAPALDELLAFADPSQCEPATAHMALLTGMVAGNSNHGFKAGGIIAPPHLTEAFGAIRVSQQGDYTTFNVSTRGTLFGLPLVEIVQALPEGGDPGAVTYRFAASPAEVERAAGRRGLPARAGKVVTLPSEGVYNTVIELLPDPNTKGHALLSCGLS